MGKVLMLFRRPKRGVDKRPLRGSDTSVPTSVPFVNPVEPSGLLGTILLGIFMLGWVLSLLGASTHVASRLAAGSVLQLAPGTTITVPGGWALASDEHVYGIHGKTLKKSGTLLTWSVRSYAGTVERLLQEDMAIIRQDFAYFNALSSSPLSIATGWSGERMLFAATSNGASIAGELTVAVTSGQAVIMLATCPDKYLSAVQADLDRMLKSLQAQTEAASGEI